MISLGIVDVILIALLAIAIFTSGRRKATTLSVLIVAILIVVIVERVAPGTLASIGNSIHGIDSINDAGPHLTIQPIIQFQR